MKQKNQFYARIFIVILFISSFFYYLNFVQVFASTSNGTIDSTFHYAWGENVGWVDFGSTAGNVHVTDSALSGSAYGENIGWIDLSTITNNNEGALSGYAWGENVGWVDFVHVAIGSDGVFSGSAYGENIGWITFGTGDNKVVTDWRPASSRVVGTTSGSRRRPDAISTPNITPNTVCNTGDKFSPETGLFCTSFTITDASIVPPHTPSVLPSIYSGPPLQMMTIAGCSIFTNILKLNNRGTGVQCLQENFNLLINSQLSADGIFGLKTRDAVILFQTTNNLTPDGIVGPITKSKLLHY